MVLTGLQRRIMQRLAANRSETSYVAGGSVLNKDWPRRSDDIDIFHDTDDAIGPAADRDIETLRNANFGVRVDLEIYGVVEATVSEYGEETKIQWMSETRQRFLPLIRDEEWGACLAPADLAVNKMLAAATRRRARDVVDLVLIAERFCPLGPVAMAAAGKLPFMSPLRIVESARRNGLGISNEEFGTVKGTPDDWTPSFMRDRLMSHLERAEDYVRTAPVDVAGRLALSPNGVPVEISNLAYDTFELRAPTEEPEAMPEVAGTVSFVSRAE